MAHSKCVAHLRSSTGRPHTCSPAQPGCNLPSYPGLLSTCPLLGGAPGHPIYPARPGPAEAPSPSSACTTPATQHPLCIQGVPHPHEGRSLFTVEMPAPENTWQVEGIQIFGKYANLYFSSWFFLDASLIASKLFLKAYLN